jgi:predicted short-subunit dehydrogenase-like oxidoreductase (DUF2520 family)
VPPEGRLVYHLAATLAAGGVVTLLAAVETLAQRLGLPAAALDGYFELARGSLEEAAATRPVSRAITGPVARGDLRTVEAEIAGLAATAPELTELVVALARATVAAVDDADTGTRLLLRRYLDGLA